MFNRLIQQIVADVLHETMVSAVAVRIWREQTIVLNKLNLLTPFSGDLVATQESCN